MKTHPLVIPSYARIDVCYGGNREMTLRDSLMIARQSVGYLSAGEHVLYINSLAQNDAIDDFAETISERHAAKVLAYHGSSRDFRQKLEMLSKMIEEKQVRVVVMNAIDLLAIGSKQKLAIVHWIQGLRDAKGVRVVVYSLMPIGTLGAMGTLRLIADTVFETCEWHHSNVYEDTLYRIPQASEIVEEMLADLLIKEPVIKPFSNEKNVKLALKNKELEVVEAEGELEYA
jgi:hypothetical protein